MTKETRDSKTKGAAPELANREGGAAPSNRPAQTAPARQTGRLRRGGSRAVGKNMFVGGGTEAPKADKK